MKHPFKKNRIKYFKGAQRICSPVKTKLWALAAVKKSKLPVFSKVMRIDDLDKLGVPVFAVSHVDTFGNCGKPSWGKGLTKDLAYVSALMERIERYSASDVGSAKDIVEKRFMDFKKNEAISRWDLVPCNLQRNLYTKSQVDRQRLLWTRCFSLTKNRNVFVPLNMVYFFPAEKFDDFSYTTGLASGNSIEEAILHALCEVIERHVEELAYSNGMKFPTVPLGTVENKEAKQLINKFISNGFNLFLTRLGEEFKIPIIRAFAYEKRGPYAGTYGHYTSIGVHPNKDIALIRALTEIIQSRASNLYHIKTKTQNIKMMPEFPDDIMEYFSKIIDHGRTVSFDEIKNIDCLDINLEIKKIISVLEKKKCEVIFKDLTHPELGIPVVRVIVKGLQPGNFGIGIIDPKHRAASITPHLSSFKKLEREIKKINY